MEPFSGHYCKSEHPVPGWPSSPSISVHHFDSTKEGPHLLVMSGIHAGTEAIPTAASETIISMLKSGMIALTRGQITIIPLCNPLALIEKKRYVDVNLNRVFKRHDSPRLYEEALSNILCDYVDRSDAVVDLHTQSTPTVPFVFNDFPELGTELALAVGINMVIEGWPKLFEESGVFNEGDSTSYAFQQGKPAIVAECGYNKDPLAAHEALKVIIRALDLYKMTENVYPPERNHTIIDAYQTIVMPENAVLAKAFRNFEPVEAGTPLILDTKTQETMTEARENAMILLPKIWAEPGMEAMFLGRVKKN